MRSDSREAFLDAAERALRIAEAREDFASFCEYCFDHPPGIHHRDWDRMLQAPPGVPGGGRYRRLLILAPRGWAKTKWMTYRIVWCLGHNPELFITYVTGDDDHAHSVGEEVALIIESNERVHEVFPNLKPDMRSWAKQQRRVKRKTVAKDASLRLCGFFSTGAGGRSHFMIFDDITSERTSIASPAIRESMKKTFNDTWLKYLLPGGVAAVIATPWHVGDVVASIEESSAWKTFRMRALDANGESTWPEVWSTDELMVMREADPDSFERQMQLLTQTGIDRAFSKGVVESCFVAKDFIDPSWPRYVGVDLAPSLSGRGSFNAIVVVAVDPALRSHIEEAYRFKREAPQVVEALADIWRRTKFVLCCVENNGYQAALMPFIERDAPGMPILGYHTGNQKFDLRQGVPSMHADMKAGLWVIERGPEHELPSHTCDHCVLLNEIYEFPHGKHKDMIMALWLATRAKAACTFEEFGVYQGSDQYDDVGDAEADRYISSAADLLDRALEGDASYASLMA